MQKIEPLLPGKFFHIYNHGVGGRVLFREPENYEFFLYLYDKYISPAAETYAWVLMPNHFHLLVRIKDNVQVRGIGKSDMVLKTARDIDPSLQYSKLFNSYAQSFNNRYHYQGALFQRRFKRKQITSIQYLIQVVLYIHNNPVHHGFCSHPLEYPWSSYITCVSAKPTKLFRDQVLHWFGSLLKFKEMHNEKPDIKKLEKLLGIDAFHSDRIV